MTKRVLHEWQPGRKAAVLEVAADQGFVRWSIRRMALRMTGVGLCAALRSPLEFVKGLIARLNRRALNAKALVCITSHGGRIAVSYPADGRTLPVVLGVNGSQMFEPGARIHIWLPALSDAQWSELKPSLQSLATLASLQIAGGHVTGADCRNSPSDWINAIEAKFGRWNSPAAEPLLVGAPE